MATTSKNARSSAEPNVLHKFASYNTLFTLSALSTRELRNPKMFFESKPHDIIVQSGGIGPDANRHEGPPSEQGQRFSAQTKATLKKNKGMQDAINRSTLEFIKNNDLYFKSVALTSIPGYNEKRRLSSVAYINMELVEPAGITLIEKVKAAAANNGFIDHLDAPYMLTIEFKGFDESGSDMQSDSNFTKRVIPIKLVTMDIDVNQAGSVYKIKAIPYNEFGLVNNFMYPRTSGTLTSSGLVTTFKDAVADLQRILNEQNKDEQTKGLNVFPDQYNISISEDLNPEAELSYEVLHQAGMTQRKEISATGEPDAFTMDYIRFSSGVNLLKLLEDLMKTHPDFGSKSFTEWEEKIAKAESATIGDPNSGLTTHFKYFRIRTGVELTTDFDSVRQTNAKIINIVVEPHYINAYNLAVAGVHQDNKYKQYVAKEYNYIFTGDNVDILDLDINYKVAYFQSRLKSLEGTTGFDVDKEAPKRSISSPTNTDNKGLLPLKSEVGIHQNASSRTGQADARVDQFFDAITNPLADMVVINMSILGDPAWLGQSQFIPATPENNNGSSKDNNIDFFRGGKLKNVYTVWNTKHKCYNYDVADAVVNLIFKTPQDFNDKTGIYEISDDQRQVFSGLYKVVQVQHNFTDGQFTQNLTMTRYNNQDNKVTVTKNQEVTIKDGVVTGLVNPFTQRRQDIISGEIGSS